VIYSSWIQLAHRQWNVFEPSPSSSSSSSRILASAEPDQLQRWKNHLRFLLSALPSVFLSEINKATTRSSSHRTLFTPSEYFLFFNYNNPNKVIIK
jgi:hypothetical protein